jgi:drug/metabolite transporter (DMT)-like permease
MDARTTKAILRWYPARWRSRYGDEFAAMIEDDLEGRKVTLRYRLSLIRSGLNERFHDAGLVGESVSPSERIRGGALSVLCAFSLFIIAGIGIAKISEHWGRSVSEGSRRLPTVSFTLFECLAAACCAAVMLAVAILLPTFAQFLRGGGWAAIKRRVGWAAAITVATAAVGAGLVVWADHLNSFQRNHGFGLYQLLFMIGAIFVAATVVSWLVAAVAATRRLDLRPGQIKIAGALAISVALCMSVMTAAAALWWGSIAAVAPWFFAEGPVRTSSSPIAINLVVVLIMMTIASAVGLFGLLRVVRSWRLLQVA